MSAKSKTCSAATKKRQTASRNAKGIHSVPFLVPVAGERQFAEGPATSGNERGEHLGIVGTCECQVFNRFNNKRGYARQLVVTQMVWITATGSGRRLQFPVKVSFLPRPQSEGQGLYGMAR